MSQCLRCSKPCEATSVFCETCRSLLRSQLWEEADTRPEGSIKTSPVVAVASGSGEVSGDPLERITGPQPVVRVPVSQLPQTPQPLSPGLPEAYAISNAVDQALLRLNEAAQRIAEVEQGSRRLPH